MSVRSAVGFLVLVLLAGCGTDPTGPGSSDAATGVVDARAPTPLTDRGRNGEPEWFTDRTEETGLDFVHFNGMSGEFYFPEIMPPGLALLDYDNDSDLDVYSVQGQMLGAGKTLSQAVFPPHGSLPLKGRLYRNDLKVHADGTRTWRFTDVTDQSGINARGYGMGVATGDFNNDGCVDLYLTNFGRNQMFRNNCDKTFTDVSKQSGTEDPGWSVSATFLDYDRDGWLDLHVGHYPSYSTTTDTKCISAKGVRDYCPPQVYRAQPSRLYHNNRNGTFTDVTGAAGMAGEFGPALGVVTADFNGDGWIDIYVANDGQENQLWINQHNSTFKNTALLSGTALTVDGKAEASMGVDAGDFDNDGDEDLFMTELIGEGSNLYVNDGSGMFQDQSARSGLGPASLPYTGFGTAWFDFDNDGWLDILAVNGTILALDGRANNPFPYDQRMLLFHNLRNGRFEDVTNRAGAVFQLSQVGRGAAFGDIDNDGDSDVVVGNLNGRVRLLVNNIGSRNHWVGLRLVGERAPRLSTSPGHTEPVEGRDMLGARVQMIRKNGPTLWRRARADGSYASANDPRVLVGLGESTEAPRVRVQWPSGRVEDWSTVPIDRYTTLKEGGGR
jgi:enediyne biosynthesis protein E4